MSVSFLHAKSIKQISLYSIKVKLHDGEQPQDNFYPGKNCGISVIKSWKILDYCLTLTANPEIKSPQSALKQLNSASAHSPLTVEVTWFQIMFHECLLYFSLLFYSHDNAIMLPTRVCSSGNTLSHERKHLSSVRRRRWRVPVPFYGIVCPSQRRLCTTYSTRWNGTFRNNCMSQYFSRHLLVKCVIIIYLSTFRRFLLWRR